MGALTCVNAPVSYAPKLSASRIETIDHAKEDFDRHALLGESASAAR